MKKFREQDFEMCITLGQIKSRQFPLKLPTQNDIFKCIKCYNDELLSQYGLKTRNYRKDV